MGKALVDMGIEDERLPSEAEIRAYFEMSLEYALNGTGPFSESLLDSETQNALFDVVANSRGDTTESIRKARQELEFQLDGTHRREYDEKMTADLRRRGLSA